jgi:hypothetical protein
VPIGPKAAGTADPTFAELRAGETVDFSLTPISVVIAHVIFGAILEGSYSLP